MKNSRHQTKPEDRVSVPRKLAFGTGLIAYTIMNNGFMNMVNIIFNVNLGLSPVLLGWVTAITRLYDAMTDPIMGAITDNTRTRWGRRRPYLVLGGFLGGLFFAALWWAPTGASDTFCFFWVLIGSLLLATAFTIYSVPYIAMSFELSRDYHERTRVMAYKVGMGKIGLIIVGSIFWWTQRPVFANTIEGMRYVGIAAGTIAFLVALVPAIFVREDPRAERVGLHQKKVPLLTSMRETLSQPSFLIIVALTLVLLCSLSLVGHMGFYVSLYYIFGGDQPASANVSLATAITSPIVALAVLPLVSFTSARLGKRRTLAFFLLIAFVGTLSKWFLYTPAAPYLQLIPNACMGAGFGATWLLLNAMIPEACDYDELQTGTRREGMFSAVYSWTFKLGTALSMIGSGYILKFSGFDAKLGGDQTADALWWMRVLFSVMPALGIIGAMFLLWIFPITEAKAYEIQDELSRRRDLAARAEDSGGSDSSPSAPTSRTPAP